MTNYLSRLRKDITESKLAIVSLIAFVVIPILSWIIVTGMDFDLFGQMFISNFSAAYQLLILPIIPSIWKDQLNNSLGSNDLTVLLLITCFLSSLFAFIIAAVRFRKDYKFDTSLVIGYMISISAIQFIGASMWMLLAFLVRTIPMY